ncbi:MAG TPA: serine protease [Burkholderiales bacterium]|jgi:serine protease Do|nr:serine protease [Burkholderiales bacterium]
MLNSLAGVVLLWLCCAAPALSAPPDPDRAQVLFDTAKDKVLKVRVVLNATQSQASVGSGFLVSSDGLVATNFHVVAPFLQRPGDYSIEFARHDGSRGSLKLVDVDVVHDLALLRMPVGAQPHFQLLTRGMWKGERGFSIGNPHDLGLTIVEGTYNGFVAESKYERIHFTGAINPGMSGGPAITREGTVFGVNVARLVNAELVSFLVPVKFVRALVESARDESNTPETLLLRARDQLLAEQDRQLGALLDAPFPLTALGPYRVPAKLGDFMRCWGRAEAGNSREYRAFVQSCLSEDSIFVFENVRTGSIDFDHVLLESRSLGPARFYRMFESRFGATGAAPGREEDFTEFRCRTDFVGSAALPLRAALCVRAYKRLPGLYDFWLRAAAVDRGDRGMLSTLSLTGVSFGNGSRFVQRYLESIAPLPAQGAAPAAYSRKKPERSR